MTVACPVKVESVNASVQIALSVFDFFPFIPTILLSVILFFNL
jgi:hypothetical protein